MAPQYSYATLTDALNALGSRLYDEQFQQWTETELTGYVVEALRTFNALSGFWRAEMTFPLVPGQWWYDLRTQAGSIIPYTVTQNQMIVQVENHLLEPPTTSYPLVWTGSAQFSPQDILSSLQRRQDDTLGTTACTLNRNLVNAPLATRVTLDDSVIDIRRVVWMPNSGFGFTNSIMRQADMWAKRAFDPTYTTAAPAPPSNWLQNTEPPPSFDVDRIPPVTGEYETLTVNSGPAWVSDVDNSPLTIPDDWTWVFKWAALADLLSRESNSKDAMRADYCRRRYLEGLALLEIMPTVLAARINNLPIGVDSIANGDDFNADWQLDPPGTPAALYTASNLVAFGPAPDGGGPYSATVSVAQNAPVPVDSGDFIQIARDDFDSIIDYAQHLAMFKSGGAEFSATVALYRSFQRKAAQYNGKLKEMGFFSLDQTDLSQKQENRDPRYFQGTGPSRE